MIATSFRPSSQSLSASLLSNLANGLEESIRRKTGQRPVQPLSLLDWALTHRYIRDKESSRVQVFSLHEYPWLEHLYKQIGEDFSSGKYDRAVIRKAAQIGATELAINLAFWVLDGQGSVFYALPPGSTQGNFAHARIDPAVGASPHISEMASRIDNVGLKTFAGGFNFYIRGTNVPKGDPSRAAQLSEAPADLAVIDEFDRVPMAAVPLIRDRLGDSRLRWELDLSTPTYPDIGIDAEYHETTQHEPQIQCAACGEWNWLDWKLVRGPIAGDEHARLLCLSCGEIIERVGMWEEERARWRPRKPDSETLGFWIPKLASERADLDEGWELSQRKRDIDRQAFWNGWMGLPYEPQGARLTRDLIAACDSNPLYPSFPDRATWTAMGVDVGLVLHYWIKERRPDGRERAVAIGSVADWEDLDVLMVRYGVQRCVVDDRPELSADKKFQERFKGKVWLGLEMDQPDAEMARWRRKEGRVIIERTKGLAEAAAKIELGIDELPENWEMVPDLVEHLTASIKAKRVRPDGSTVYHYPQTGKPDHLHHAKEFCEVAMLILPKTPAWEAEEKEEGPTVSDDRYYAPGSMRGRL